MISLLNAKLCNSFKLFNQDWDDFFDPCTPNKTSEQKIGIRKQFENTHIYVCDCSFINCFSSECGGAIETLLSLFLLIESSVFDNCTTTGERGGAIYYSNINGHFVCHMVCGYKCNCKTQSSNGQFLYSHIEEGINNKGTPQQPNAINDSSVSFSFNCYEGAKYTMDIAGGNITIQRVNITSNLVGSQVAFRCLPANSPSLSETITNINTFTMTFSSIVNNSALSPYYGYNCFEFGVVLSEKCIHYCNIIKNSQNSDTWGLLHCVGEVLIKDCCLLENICKFLIQNVDRTHNVTVINCSIDREYEYYNGYVQIREKVSPFVFAIQHINTANCVAQYDAISDIPTIEITKESNEKKIVYTFHSNIRKYQKYIYIFVSF